MKKNYSLCLGLFLLIALTNSLKLTSQVNMCGAADIHNQLMLTDPEYIQKMQTYEDYVQTIQNSAQKTAGVVYQIPVVVHVMHKGEAVGTGVNVSDAAILNAIKELNEMYRKLPGTQWFGNGVDVEIEYALAVRDPNGNCTNGITRTSMTGNSLYMSNGVKRNPTTGSGITDATLKAAASWPRNDYYNIWLISEIDNNNGGAGVQGYAYFASSHGTAQDGAVILSSNFTSGGSSTAAHEIGHSLNLYHTFEGDGGGGACPTGNQCGSNLGDCCGDTPPHKQSPSNCPVGTNACNGGSSNDLFIHNFMDYSSDACKSELTANQKTRMQTALTTTRASYLASNGNNKLVPVAVAGVDFSASATVLCGTGQSVKFMDKSSCVPNSYTPLSSFPGITHLWTITNGTSTYTSNAQNPQITFTNTGTFDVTLTVTNSFGTSTLTKAGMIIVSAAPVNACTPTSSNTGNYGQTVFNVNFNSISHSSSTVDNTPYVNLACSYNTTVTAGSIYNAAISVRAASSGVENFDVCIDYNNNGSFTDAGESVFTGSTPANTSNTFTSNITIPATAVQNTLLRMRVFGEFGTISAAKKSCSSAFTIGDVADYGVYIKSNGCTTPTITVTPTSTTICSGQSTTLTAGGATSYTWLPSGSGASNVVSPTGTTVYTVTGSTGTCVSVPKTVTVNVTSVPIITITPTSTTICSGQSATLTASGAATYTWLPSGSGTSNVVSPTGTTVYTVSGSNGSCVSTPKTATVNVTSVPVVTITPASTTICSGQSATLTASGASTYTWLPTGSGASNVVSPTGTTIYTVSGSNGTCVSVSKTATVNVASVPVITITPTSTTICSGQSATLTASGATSYTWLPSGSGASNVVSPTGTTVYTVTGSNGSCLAAQKTTTVNVTSAPVITITPISTTICSGQSTTLTATGAATYTWLPSGSGATKVVSPTGTSVYTVTGSNGSCISLPKTATVNVTSNPVVFASASPTLICKGYTSTLTAGGATSYSWSPASTLSNSTGSMVVANPTVTTTYIVSGTTGVCSSTASIVLNVSLCTGVEDLLDASELIVFPNPSDGVFTIVGLENDEAVYVEITNALGQVVKTEAFANTDQIIINMNDVSKGIYYMKVTTEGGSKLFKLILQ